MIRIEIPRGSTVKYEWSQAAQALRIDRRVDMAYPQAYGFLPGTLGGDGDPLDAFVMGPREYYPGEVLQGLTPVGVITLRDGGQSDDKYLYYDGRVQHISDTKRICAGVIAILTFLRLYKFQGRVNPIRLEAVTLDPALPHREGLLRLMQAHRVALGHPEWGL